MSWLSFAHHKRQRDRLKNGAPYVKAGHARQRIKQGSWTTSSTFSSTRRMHRFYRGESVTCVLVILNAHLLLSVGKDLSMMFADYLASPAPADGKHVSKSTFFRIIKKVTALQQTNWRVVDYFVACLVYEPIESLCKVIRLCAEG